MLRVNEIKRQNDSDLTGSEGGRGRETASVQENPTSLPTIIYTQETDVIHVLELTIAWWRCWLRAKVLLCRGLSFYFNQKIQ